MTTTHDIFWYLPYTLHQHPVAKHQTGRTFTLSSSLLFRKICAWKIVLACLIVQIQSPSTGCRMQSDAFMQAVAYVTTSCLMLCSMSAASASPGSAVTTGQVHTTPCASLHWLLLTFRRPLALPAATLCLAPVVHSVCWECQERQSFSLSVFEQFKVAGVRL